MTSLPCSSRSKRVHTKISILALSFIGHLECPGISEAFSFDRQPFVFYSQSFDNKDAPRLGTVQKSMINFLVERFKRPFTIYENGVSPNFDPFKFGFVLCLCCKHLLSLWDIGKKFGVINRE